MRREKEGFGESLRQLGTLEELSRGDTALHRLHPAVKLAVSACYVVCVMSFQRPEPLRLLPYLLLALLAAEAADIPPLLLWRRTLPALPFCLFAGTAGLIVSREPVFFVGGLAVTAGMLSFACILVRTVLCVGAVLLLMALTPLSELTGTLRALHVPEAMVLLLEMTYRYLSVLGREGARMLTAYRLRSGGRAWPAPAEFGALTGRLLLSGSDRAARVLAAMRCRLYGAGEAGARERRRMLTAADAAALGISAAACIGLRVFDVNGWLGGLLL